MPTYPTNLTENQWKFIEKVLNNNRKRKHDLKAIFNAIFYLWFITIIRTCFHEGHKFSNQNIPCLYTHMLYV